MSAAGYDWLLAGERPGEWLAQGCCLTYAPGIAPDALARTVGLAGLARVTFPDTIAAESSLCEVSSIALWPCDCGTIAFQPYGIWADVGEPLGTTVDSRVVVACWNVEMDNIFQMWDRGRLVLDYEAFEAGQPRVAADPSLVRALTEVGLTEDDDSVDFRTAYVDLAERLTGCVLRPEFLLQDLYVGNV